METTAYAAEAELETSHWWFVARREMLARLIAERVPSRVARVLDLGTSTGTNLRLLRDLGFEAVVGVDRSVEAIRWCRDKRLGDVIKGDVCALPFGDQSFDLVLATDIIEHVARDDVAVSEIFRVLVPGGTAIITVPAFRALWGLQDDLAHHLRRYRLPEIERITRATGLAIVQLYYFNYLLFVPIFLARQVIRRLGIRVRSENDVNAKWLNRVLLGIFRCDVRFAPRLRPPFGVSICLIGERPAGAIR